MEKPTDMNRLPTRLASALTLCLITGFAVPASAGIFIGNPIVIEGLTTDQSSLETANGSIANVTLEICNRSATVVETIDAEVDLANEVLTLDVPSAEYCKVEIKYSSDVDFDGDAGGGWSLTSSMDTYTLVPNAAEEAFELEITEITAADVVFIASE